MNPFYDHFKTLVGEGIGGDDDDIGDVYKSILFQRGYGLQDNTDFDATYGLGFGDALSSLFRLATPMFKKGLQYLGNQAVNTVANIAHDTIAGENVVESAKRHVGNAANDVFAKAPAVIAQSVMKNRGIKRAADIHSAGSNRGRSIGNRSQNKRFKRGGAKIGRGLLNEFPALKKII